MRVHHPVDLQLDAPLEVARWRPFVAIILAIPHLIIANILDQVAGAMAFVSWFIIVFTGTMPEGIANFQCMVLRYEARALAYMSFMHEDFPPFDFTMSGDEPGGHPLRVQITPAIEDRNRTTVALRLLTVIPILLFAAFVAIGAAFAMIAAALSVLFTGRWPEGVRRFAVDAARLMLRVNAYARLVVDEYPPFAVSER